MKSQLVGFQQITPKTKAPFTNLYVSYPKHDVVGKVTESIYVHDGFPLPELKVGMMVDIDRDGRGYLLAITEAAPTLGSTPAVSAPKL